MHRCHLCGSIDVQDHDEFYRTCQPNISDSCDACKELDLMNNRISETKVFLQTLLDQRRELKSKLNNVHGSIIHRMPMEVASSIFVYAVEEALQDGGDVEAAVKLQPLALGAVCQAWRNIAWSTPGIWRFLTMGLSSRTSPRHADVAIEWLNRSGSHPLSIKLYWLDPEDGSAAVISESLHPLVDALNQSSHRWYSLYLQLPSRLLEMISDENNPSSILHKLDINGMQSPNSNCIGIVHATPKIVNYSNLYFGSLGFQWGNVTHLSVSSLYLSDIWDLFREAPQLTNCVLRLSYIHENVAGDDDEGCKHAQLKSLDVEFGRSRSIHFFFATLILPALTDLRIRLHGAYVPQALTSFLSYCSLKNLTLIDADIIGEDLVQIMKLTPALSSLHLTGADIGTFDPFYQSLSAHLLTLDDQAIMLPEPLLPVLNSFTLSGGCPDVARLITGLFSPFNLQKNASRRPLEDVEIFCTCNERHQIPYLDRATLNQIAGLRAEGVKIRIGVQAGTYQGDLVNMSLNHIEEPR